MSRPSVIVVDADHALVIWDELVIAPFDGENAWVEATALAARLQSEIVVVGAAVAREEREACAKLAESAPDAFTTSSQDIEDRCNWIARQIRARGEP